VAPAPTLRLISWPFDSGAEGVGMGAGSAALAASAGVSAALEEAGWGVRRQTIDAADPELPEIGRTIELDRRLAGAVATAVADGEFPLVLAGNCISSLGTTAGLGPNGLGVVWLDAHADYDVPDQNLSGFFDVMGLAILTGSGWRALRETIPGFEPIPADRVVLAGVRDLEPYQRRALDRSSLAVVGDEIEPGRLTDALRRLDAERVYLHLDLDVVDAGELAANRYAAAGGPSLDRVEATIERVFDRFPVAGAALTAYDPSFDRDGAAERGAVKLLSALARAAAAQEPPARPAPWNGAA
jgi:arginase